MNDALRRSLRTIVSLTSLAVFSASLSPAALSQSGPLLSVRLLDAKSGKPIKGVSVALLVGNEEGRPVSIFRVTATDGLATYQLPAQVPERVGIDFSPIEVWVCSDIAFLTDPILKTGIVAKYKCAPDVSKQAVAAATPKPGELIISTRRISRRQLMLRELP